MLSCDTFLWWMAGTVYPFNDPDAVELTGFQRGEKLPEEWVKSRIISAVVTGGNFLDADPFDDPVKLHRRDHLDRRRQRLKAVNGGGIDPEGDECTDIDACGLVGIGLEPAAASDRNQDGRAEPAEAEPGWRG